ncbi:1-aminocyclopropane-1-carboxylate deaminase/D-cysteine desulfhydrase [Cyclobacterium salsum]|uniref:1-aminocyclopropane-1-carboxylate deaminase/D-cysteine desulfhydrase n=1 Tax=Cyclobacterium salsum TaxID=2666329 RepID=UPI00139158AB|nr:pyridoxal-phosphate dependent enzyme [Cyclobacterium salsum]
MESDKSPIYQPLELPLLYEKKVHVVVKRLDLMHPGMQGNKYYKLRYNIQEAKKSGHTQVLTFGGAYSNHIHATAMACAEAGIQAVGIIRGAVDDPLNPTLADAREQGMRLYPLSRSDYREKQSDRVIAGLRQVFGDFYLIPEGGTNAFAIRGASEILSHEDASMQVIALPVGTGGTLAGIAASALPHQQVLGFSALKGDFIRKEVQQLLEAHHINPPKPVEIQTDFHFGGYAKFTPELIGFIKHMQVQANLPLDPIYTGKLFFGLLELIRKDYFPKGIKILALHTGGLQGIRGFNQRFGLDL